MTEDDLMNLPDRIMYKHKEKSKKPLYVMCLYVLKCAQIDQVQ